MFKRMNSDLTTSNCFQVAGLFIIDNMFLLIHMFLLLLFPTAGRPFILNILTIASVLFLSPSPSFQEPTAFVVMGNVQIVHCIYTTAKRTHW